MKIIGSTLTLPHSNAAVERIFSQVRLIKTDLRNSLKPCSLVSLLHLKNGLSRAGISAHELTLDIHLKDALNQVVSDATEEECQQKLAALYKIS